MKRHLAQVALLLAVSAAVQCWMVRTAATPALDAVRYVAIAQRMEREGVWPAIRGESEHPLFPLLVYVVHAARGAVRPQAPHEWAASVHVAAAIPLLLCVVPVYFLLLRLIDRRAALGGTLLFCLLPQTARLGADGISDSTHLFLAVTAMGAIVEWLAKVAAVRVPAGDGRGTGGPRGPGLPAATWLLLAGGAVGLALTARAEAVLLAPCLAAVVLWDQMRQPTRRPRSDVVLGAGCLFLGLAAVLCPYLLAVEDTTPHRALARVFGRGDGPAAKPHAANSSARTPPKQTPLAADGTPLSFPAKESSTSARFRGFAPAVREYARELAEVFHYAFGGLALWGLWTKRRPWRAEDRFCAVLFVTVSLSALYVGSRAGYLAARHLLLIVPAGLGWAAVGADDLGSRIANCWSGLRGTAGRLAGAADACRSSLAARRSLLGAAAIVAAAVVCLPRLASPLHVSRGGHRRAGEWLAAQRDAGLVLDTRGWTGLYSGLETRRYDEALAAFRDPRLAYVVVEQSELQVDSSRAETLRYLLGTSATLAAEFDDGGASGSPQVLVYRWQPERLAWRDEERRLK